MNWPLAWQVILGVCVLAALGAAIAALTLILTHSDPAPYKPPAVLPVARGGTGETSLDALKDTLGVAVPKMLEFEGTMEPPLTMMYTWAWDSAADAYLFGLDYVVYFETKSGAVTKLSFPNVQFVQWGFTLGAPKLKRLDFPDAIWTNAWDLYDCTALVEIHVPKLRRLDFNINIHDAPELETLEMPAMELFNGYIIVGNTKLTRLDLPVARLLLNLQLSGTTGDGFAISAPNLTQLGGAMVNVSNLVGFDVGTTMRSIYIDQDVVVKGTTVGLNQATVDAILTDLAANTGYANHTIDVGGANAAPNASAAIATLEGRGCTVTHN